MKKRVLLSHLSKACPVVDIPIYGTLAQTDLEPNAKVTIIVAVTLLKFLVIVIDYNSDRPNTVA